ncbi:MAG: 4Fe-4S dicluster domain-containing protein, partial [Candidatus Heimdallarchaeota archaeon]|nr:4Fe-4S dicluster domain-containing protein [Candidatus Heimdallarchaeota archaeon]
MNIKIQKKLCVPTQCKHECVSICPQNKKGKEAIKIGKSIAEVNNQNCINCLQCVYVCPFEAIQAVSKTKKVISQQKLKQTKPSRESKKDKKPYEMDEDVYEPFNEKYTIFSRRTWDEEYKGYKKPIYAKAQERAAMGLDGYSEIEGA